VVTIRRLKNKSAEAVIEGFKDVHQSMFYDFKAITSDNGTEFAGHEEVAKITGADFYFAKPYSSSIVRHGYPFRSREGRKCRSSLVI